jgi:hypothetical protein
MLASRCLAMDYFNCGRFPQIQENMLEMRLFLQTSISDKKHTISLTPKGTMAFYDRDTVNITAISKQIPKTINTEYEQIIKNNTNKYFLTSS